MQSDLLGQTGISQIFLGISNYYFLFPFYISIFIEVTQPLKGFWYFYQ